MPATPELHITPQGWCQPGGQQERYVGARAGPADRHPQAGSPGV